VGGLGSLNNEPGKNPVSLTDKKESQIVSILVKMLEEPDEIIRTRAAAGLKNYRSKKIAIASLKKKLSDKSVYVQRAAADSLALFGEKEGVTRLIETLQFPSINTFRFYGHEIQAELAYYCGVDFPENTRYRYQTWKNWWDANRQDVDLEKNLQIMTEIEKAFALSNENEGVKLFDSLLQRYPNHLIIRNRYKRFLIEWIDFRLLTKETVDEAVYRRCIRLQKKLIRLFPEEPSLRMVLAEFYTVIKEYEKAVSTIKGALKLEPENHEYQMKLQRLQDLTG
jgi:tetratricopeptide (TPR) repeat protein